MRSKMVVGFLLLLAVLASLASPVTARAENELIVSAAASLTHAFQEVAQKFQTANPGVKVVTNFAASGSLLAQIEQGAPVDVFASADQKTMNQATEKELILTETRKNFVSNRLVLIVPTESKLGIKSLRDLTKEGVTKVTMGNPESVPVGRYTQEVLTAEGLWEALKPRFINGNSVRQVLDYVMRGEVDAGFVFSTDAAIAKDKVRVVATMEKHQPIVYPLAVVAATQKKDLALKFIDFTLAAEGQAVLARYGFGKP